MKRVGVNIESDTRSGFTAVVACELDSINMAAPFCRIQWYQTNGCEEKNKYAGLEVA